VKTSFLAERKLGNEKTNKIGQMKTWFSQTLLDASGKQNLLYCPSISEKNKKKQAFFLPTEAEVAGTKMTTKKIFRSR